MPSVHLLRHGAHEDVGQRLTGRLADNGLTEQGRVQARLAALQLAATPPSAIYASPRRRTQESAAILGRAFRLPVKSSPELDEVDFGEFAGRRFDDLDSDPMWQEWNARRSTARCPGGETMGEAQARALAFAFEVAARHDQAPLLVTHCDIIRALHCWSDRVSLDAIHGIDCPPGGLSRLDLSAKQLAAA